MGLILNRRREMGGGEVLPYDAQIQYLQSSGTQYINSGVKFTTDNASGIDIKYMPTATGGVSVMGSCINDTLWFVMYLSGGSFYIGTSGNLFSNQISVNTIYEASYRTTSGKSVTQVWNGTSTTKTYNSTIVSNCNIGIFEQMDNNNPMGKKAKGRLYYFKIYNNGSLVRDFIPVRVGQVGYLYDKVSKTLFGNSGSGSFTLGPDV